MGIKAKLMSVTPRKAQEWLEKNTGNRAVSAAIVDRYAVDMASGRWQENGEPVIFNGDSLLDGQHRLHAVIKADRPVPMLVVSGVDRNAFRTIDSGRARTFAHVLQSQGEKNAFVRAATACLLYFYECGTTPFRTGGKGVHPTKPQLSDLLARHPKLSASVDFADEHRTPLLTPSVVAFCHYLFSKIDRDAADKFVVDFATGDGVRASSPVGLLRARLIAERSARASKIDRRLVVYFFFRAWNATRSGERLLKLQTPTSATSDPRGLSVDLPDLV
jgi:hypothetical protein